MEMNSADETSNYGIVAGVTFTFVEGMGSQYPGGMRLTPSAFGALNAEIPASPITGGMGVAVEHIDADTTRVTVGSSLEDFDVFIDVESIDDEPNVVGIRICPPTGERVLQSSAFAKLGLSSLQRKTRETLRQPLVRSLARRGGDKGFHDPFLEIPRPGRAGRPDIEYAIWADRYVAALKASPRAPMKHLMEQNPGFGAHTLRAIMSKARDRNLLTAAGQGVAGGEITDRATELLRSHNQPVTSTGA